MWSTANWDEWKWAVPAAQAPVKGNTPATCSSSRHWVVCGRSSNSQRRIVHSIQRVCRCQLDSWGSIKDTLRLCGRADQRRLPVFEMLSDTLRVCQVRYRAAGDNYSSTHVKSSGTCSLLSFSVRTIIMNTIVIGVSCRQTSWWLQTEPSACAMLDAPALRQLRCVKPGCIVWMILLAAFFCILLANIIYILSCFPKPGTPCLHSVFIACTLHRRTVDAPPISGRAVSAGSPGCELGILRFSKSSRCHISCKGYWERDYCWTTVFFFPAHFVTLFAVIWLDVTASFLGGIICAELYTLNVSLHQISVPYGSDLTLSENGICTATSEEPHPLLKSIII